MMKANNGMEQVEEEEEKCQIFFRQTDKCRSLSRLFVYYSLFFSFFAVALCVRPNMAASFEFASQKSNWNLLLPACKRVG